MDYKNESHHQNLMTPFQRDISGKNGEFWQRSAKRDVARMVQNARKNAVVEEDGAIRWNTGNYLPDDCCEMLEYAGYPFSRKATERKRQQQVAKRLAEYRARATDPSLEELDEMQNAFGKGATVVNVITGKKYHL